MTDAPGIEWTADGRVARLTLNRPERRNALDRAMLLGLAAGLDRSAEDDAVRVTVLRGAGPSFCSGFDVTPPAATGSDAGYGTGDGPAQWANLSWRMQKLFSVWDHPKPVVAAVHGHCLGAGTVLAVLADVTVVSTTARIGVPSLPLGGGYLTPVWVHLVGPKRAKELSFQPGVTIDGEEAVAWGWANACVAMERLDDEVDRLAANIARTPADLLALKKAAINRMVELGGMRTGAMVGALTDTVAHDAPELEVIRRALRERGVHRTVEDFGAGELEL